MKKMYCPKCGGEIIVTYEIPPHSFEITDDSLKSINNYAFGGGDPELEFYCINDKEHNLDPHPDVLSDFDQWMEEVNQFFNDNVLPCLL